MSFFLLSFAPRAFFVTIASQSTIMTNAEPHKWCRRNAFSGTLAEKIQIQSLEITQPTTTNRQIDIPLSSAFNFIKNYYYEFCIVSAVFCNTAVITLLSFYHMQIQFCKRKFKKKISSRAGPGWDRGLNSFSYGKFHNNCSN